MGKRRKREAEEDAEEQVRDRRREGVDFSKFARDPSLADETLGGAFGKPQDRGQFGDLSRGGRPRGANRRWAAEPEAKRQVSGYTSEMWAWFQAVADGEWARSQARPHARHDDSRSPKTLPVSRNIREGKALGKRARRSDNRKYNPQRYTARRFTGFVRVNGRRTYCDHSDRYDGYDKSIYDRKITSLRSESYSHDEFGDDGGDIASEWQEHLPSNVDNQHRDDSASPRSYRQHSPDGNVWQRTGRRGKKSYPHPLDRDGDRPRKRPDWRELQPLFPAVWKLIDDILRPDEKYVFVQHYLGGEKVPNIAKSMRPKISKQSAYKPEGPQSHWREEVQKGWGRAQVQSLGVVAGADK